MANPGFLDAYRDELLSALSEEGCDAASARRAVLRAEAKIRRDWGGMEQYIAAPDKTTRDRQIMLALEDGAAPEQVAKAHDVHPRTVRRVKQRQRDDNGFGSDEWVL